ncbi:uncharacterized protein [Drosophila kikkawai]|uniref:Uncharacterized protein n=1 Tax=Drosophila kikkawai TaxID=30033 RepID=A0A6P4IHD5_DROKI|nr:uncharacterized protein LOC108078400 [Drosophila kikkawai]
MSVDALIVSFSELQAIDQEDIIMLVDVQTAIRICNESLTNDSASLEDVLLLWLSKLLRSYVDEAVCCVNAIKEMWSWLERVTVDPKYNGLAIVTEALNFVTVYKDHLLRGGERLVHSSAFFFLTMIKSFPSDRSTLKICIDLHLVVLSLLRDNTAEAKTVNTRITPVIKKLTAIAEYFGQRITHVQVSIRTSETVTFMCVHYLELIKQQPRKESEPEPMPEWLKDTLVHLCDTVCSHLETVHNKETLAIPLEKIEDYLKVTRTYLQMIQEIFRVGVTTHFSEAVGSCLLELFSEPAHSHDLGKDIPALLSTYVKPYTMQLFELVYFLPDFQEDFINNLVAGEDSFNLCLSFVTVVCTDNTAVSPNTCQTLQRIFEYLFRDASNFVHAENYDRVIEAFGSLLYLLDNDILFNYFCAGLFQKDLVSSQACADVLMLCFRLKEVNNGWDSKAIEHAARFWNECSNSYALFSHNPSQWHVQRFLKYFHIMSRQKLPSLSIRNYRYLSAVTGSRDPIGRHLLKHLEDISYDVPTEIANYYEIIAVLEILAQLGQTNCGSWLKRTSEMAKQLMAIDKGSTFISSYFRLVLASDQATQLLVLRGLAPVIGCTNWQRQKFLAACQSSTDAQLRAFSARHTISGDVQPLLEALVGKREDLPSAVDATCQELGKSSYSRQVEHKCQPEASLKRKRTEENTPRKLLQALYEGSLELKQCSRDSFDAADKELHRKIIANLSSILP